MVVKRELLFLFRRGVEGREEGRGALLGGTGGDIVPTTASGGAVMALRGVAEVRELERERKKIRLKEKSIVFTGLSLVSHLRVVCRSGAVV